MKFCVLCDPSAPLDRLGFAVCARHVEELGLWTPRVAYLAAMEARLGAAMPDRDAGDGPRPPAADLS